MIKRILCLLALACACTGALAAEADHLGGKIFAPPGVQQGGASQFFVPGGTVFKNPDGTSITVPTQTFTPYPLNVKQYMDIFIPGVPTSQAGDPDRELLRKWVHLNFDWKDIDDARFNRGETLPDFQVLDLGSSEDVSGRSAPPPAGDAAGGGFQPLPPGDMPTPSVDDVRDEIG